MQFFPQIREDDILALKDFSTNQELMVGFKLYAAERIIPFFLFPTLTLQVEEEM